MYLGAVLETFAKKSPVSVITRALFEHALTPDALDDLFRTHAEHQYERELLFSSVVDLMGMVVCQVQPSLHTAYKQVQSSLPVSLTSVYNKVNGLEPAITRALVQHTADRLRAVIVALGATHKPWIKGYRTRVVDGNHLRATERRLGVLAQCAAGPLPGHSLVVYEPELGLVVDMLPCEDGHAQERSLLKELAELVSAGDVWIADRNFCTLGFLDDILTREGAFVIRQHANLPIASSGTLRSQGRTETGAVFEQDVTVRMSADKTVTLRRIVLRLDKPTRDGDDEVGLLTNLPNDAADAQTVAEAYRKRWTLETLFFELTQWLEGEVSTLGYPKAALFAFGIALVSYNLLSSTRAALRAEYGEEVLENVSSYYVANEVRTIRDGMNLIVEPSSWEKFRTMTPVVLASHLRAWAGLAALEKYTKSRRGPKKPVPKRTRYTTETHVSTARLLAEKGRS